MATTVINEEGVDVGTTPTVYAGQPANKLLCKINYSGSEDASAFTLGGTIGGGAGAYFKIVKPAADTAEYGTTFASTEFWIAYTSLRLPDTATGTITFDGPTGLTTLNPTVISSLGRPMTIEESMTRYGESIFALITTENWLRFIYCQDRSDSVFQPVPANATFPDGEFTANKPSDVATIMAGLSVGSGQKYRIKCKDIGDSTWANTSVVWSTTGSAKNFAAAGGYLVIEPDPVSPPSLVGRYFITHQWEGVHIRNFSWPGAPSGGGRDGFCLSCSGTNAQIILENIDFIDPDWSQDDSVNGTKVFVQVSNAKCFRVLNCNLRGANRDLTFLNCYVAEINGVDVGQTPDDFCDPAMDCKHIDRWDSDDLVMIIRNCRVCNLYDKYTGKHLDFSQYSTTISYPGGNITTEKNPTTQADEYRAKSIVVGDFRIVGSHVYKCTVAGATPYRADANNPDPPLPSHISGTAVDGSDPLTNPTFQYWGEVGDLPRQYSVVYSNVCITGGQVKQSTSSDHAAAQFLINSHEGPLLYSVFNNFSCTTEVLGLGIHCPYQTERNYFEYNSLMGPHEVPVGGFYFDQKIQNAPLAKNNGKCRAYKNMAAGFGANLFAEGNVVVKGKAPGVGQSYPDHCKCTISDFTIRAGDSVWLFSFTDDNSDEIDDSKGRLSKLFHSLDRRIGARGKESWPLEFRVVDANGQASNTLTQTVSFSP